MLEIEIWREIKYYEGYYLVSSLGRIRSLKRTIQRHNGKAAITQKILRLSTEARTGYLKVNLSKGGKVQTRYIHKLVATAFHNHKPNGYVVVVDHIDSDRQNNRADNLQCISQAKNIQKIYDKDETFEQVDDCPF